jgi:class 3 adenylate cyclase
MKESLSKFNQNSGQKLEIRIGIHSGPVVAGVIGKKKFTYDVWGED